MFASIIFHNAISGNFLFADDPRGILKRCGVYRELFGLAKDRMRRQPRHARAKSLYTPIEKASDAAALFLAAALPLVAAPISQADREKLSGT